MTRKSPEISVIIPTFNSAHFLPEALESIFSQTYQGDMEIIVVNDGSTDDTGKIVRSYRKELIYVEQENAGPASARNTGISYARGEYIAFLDADDLWLPCKLEEQMNVFSLNPDVAIVYSQMVNFDQATHEVSSPWPSRVYSGRVFERLLIENFIPLPSVVIKTSVLMDVGGFDEGLITAEDTNLYLRVAKKFQIAGVRKALVRRRIHGSNLSERVDIDIGTLTNLDRLVDLFPEMSPREDLRMRRAYVSRGIPLIRECFYKSQYVKCHEACTRLLSISACERIVLAYWLITLLPSSWVSMLRRVRKLISGLL